MIKIFYNGSNVLATDTGEPINPPSYWTQEILDGIAASYALGEGIGWEVIPDPEPPPPAPDWLSFNLAMVPPTTESTFEVWLGQFKEPYRAALVVASSEGNAERVQVRYEILKAQSPPTTEQIAEWQGIADANHVPLRF